MKCSTLVGQIFLMCAFQGWAFEPFPVDVTQANLGDGKIPEEADHLRPQTDRVPEIGCLVLYREDRSFDPGNFVTIERADERYLLRWSVAPPTLPLSQVLKIKPNAVLEIPSSLAKLAYEIWVNALLETRYGRHREIGCDGTTYTFSTFAPKLGQLNGQTWSPEADLPPKWMVEAGNMLVAFANDPQRDPKQLEAQLTATRNKLFAYLKEHSKHD